MADIGTQFTIIALGSPELLVNVLNGLAMMGSDGTLKGLAKVAALGGLLSMIVSSIVSQRHEYYKMLTAFMLYSVLFGTTATVKVESLYTGEITPVAHVPIGIAMPMAMATTIGNKLTKEMETVFSIPGVTLKDGGVDALGWLARSHDLAIPDPKLSMTVAAYVRDCVLTSINSTVPEPDQITLDGWQTATDLLVTMGRANYAAISTVTYLAGDLEGGQVRSCAAAYDAFQPAMLAAMVDINVQKQLGAQLGMHISDNSGTPVTDKLAAVKTTIDKAAGGAQLYMQNALIQNEFRCQTAGVGDASCITLTEGSEKRRAQWASEQAFFKQIARPLMAFAESFLPAMAPMMLVVLLIAPGSMAVVGTYFKLVASLALWTPLMALINFYLTSSVSGHLGNIAAAVDPNSVAYMSSTWTTIADYVSVGGMMYASVPMLAYGIVSGTGGLSSALGSRAQAASGGADASNTMAPALAQTGAVVSHGAGMQTAPGLVKDAMSPAMNSGGAAQLATWGTATASASTGTEETSAAGQQVTKASQAASTARQSYLTSVGRSIASTTATGTAHKDADGTAHEHSRTSAAASSLANSFKAGAEGAQKFQAALDFAAGKGLSKADTKGLLSTVAGALTGGLSAGGAVSVTGKQGQAIDDAVTANAQTSDASKASRTSGNEDTSSKILATALNSQSVQSASAEVSRTETDQKAATAAYQTASKRQESRSAAGSVDANTAMAAASKDPALATAMAAAANDGTLVAPQALQSARRSVSTLGLAPQDERNAAHALALIQGGGAAQGALLDAMAASGRGVHSQPLNGMTSGAHKGIAPAGSVGLSDQAAQAAGATAVAAGQSAQAAGQAGAHAAMQNPAVAAAAPAGMGGPGGTGGATSPGAGAPVAATAPVHRAHPGHALKQAQSAGAGQPPTGPGSAAAHDRAFAAAAAQVDADPGLNARDTANRGAALNHAPDAAVRQAGHDLRMTATPAELGRQTTQLGAAALQYAAEHPGLAVAGVAGTAAGVAGWSAAVSGMRKFAGSPAGQRMLATRVGALAARVGASTLAGPGAPMIAGVITAATAADTASAMYSAAKAGGYIK